MFRKIVTFHYTLSESAENHVCTVLQTGAMPYQLHVMSASQYYFKYCDQKYYLNS